MAAFYNSSVLENNVPSITWLSFDSKELGARACKNLLRQIEGEETENRTLLPYEVVLKAVSYTHLDVYKRQPLYSQRVRTE